MKNCTGLFVFVLLLLGSACERRSATPTLVPTPTPPVPKILTVCLESEPSSLYLYGASDPAARHIWQAIYDGPIDSRDYTYQPIILARLPRLADGSAAVQMVAVQGGDRVLAADGTITVLTPGVHVRDASGQRVTFVGAPLWMPQMVATFTLRSDLYWSDGLPLTADDSVFSFELAADPATPGDKTGVERTADYDAVDRYTVVWRGVPGFLDHFYYLNFWSPLPRHAWEQLSAADLLTASVATRQPLGWGPFVIQEWTLGDRLVVARNPHYFRAEEGLPRVDQVVFRFVSTAEEAAGGGCDVVTHELADRLGPAFPSSLREIRFYDARWELVAFGITPADGYDRPDLFEDERVRRGVAMCINRQALAHQAEGDYGRVWHTYLPPDHPLYAHDAATWRYDPAAGQELLTSAGWYDVDGDSVREAHSVPGIPEGAPFEVTYLTTDDPARVQTAQLVQAYLSLCGIRVSVEIQSPQMLFAPGPEGALFGRRFDLAQFAWRVGADPLCDLFLSGHIPGEGDWERPNVAGFLDDAYDAACLSALEAFPDSAEYAAGQREAQRIFSQRLPVLPLFQHTRIVLVSESVIGLDLDPSSDSELWNIEQLDRTP